MTGEAEEFFGKVREGLEAAGVAYELDPHLVRGLDYYRHTAFEFVTDRLGAQGTVIAGGRYDGLIESLGGPHTPAIGWAAGIERLAMLIDAPEIEQIDAAIVVEDDAALGASLAAASRLRAAGLSVEIVATGSPRKRFDRAVKKGAREIVVLGFADGAVTRRSQVERRASGGGIAGRMKTISLDRIVSIEAKKHELGRGDGRAQPRARGFRSPLQGICPDRAGRRRGPRGPSAARRTARC